MKIESHHRQSLRNAVERKFGKPIQSNAECLALVDLLSAQEKSVTAQTVRRFFRIIPYDGGFNSYTLDAFAKFCGYQNFASFKNAQSEKDLADFFGDQNGSFSQADYWQKGEQLCITIQDSPELLANVHHELMKFPQARIFFIEHHPMRDLSCTVYAQYFQEYLKYHHSNEARLFAYGFLFMGAFLSQNEEFMDIYFQKIQETDLTSDIYVLPAGRKFGVPLLYYWLKKDDDNFRLTYNEMLKARDDYKEASEKSVCSFEYAVLEHLLYTDKTDEMKFLIENNTFQQYSDRDFVPQNRKENHEEVWKIMCSVAYYHMKDFDTCHKHLNSVWIDHLSVGWKKYYSILYLFIVREFLAGEEKDHITQKIADLMEETHFSYYEKYLGSTAFLQKESV